MDTFDSINKEYEHLIRKYFLIDEEYVVNAGHYKSIYNSALRRKKEVDLNRTNISSIIDYSSRFTIDEAIEVFTDVKEMYGNITIDLEYYNYDEESSLDVVAHRDLDLNDYRELFKIYVIDYLNIYYYEKTKKIKKLIGTVRNIKIEDLKQMEVI